jgi:hypothetical protein
MNSLITKTRRIIDEWGTGVKRKISLSFKGIMDIARAVDGVRGQTARRRAGDLKWDGLGMTSRELPEWCSRCR